MVMLEPCWKLMVELVKNAPPFALKTIFAVPPQVEVETNPVLEMIRQGEPAELNEGIIG